MQEMRGMQVKPILQIQREARTAAAGKINLLGKKDQLDSITYGRNHLSNYFANVVCSDFKQDIAFLLDGKKGTGKSYAGLRLGFNTAVAIANRVHRDPDRWEEHFNIDHVAIISPQASSTLMVNAKKHDVLMFDDIGLGWNSRKSFSNENIKKNDTFQINRINNCVQIFTLPQQFLIDKVVRNLTGYIGEMISSHHEDGYASMKVFKSVILGRLGNKQITPRLVKDGAPISEHLIMAPPRFLSAEYDRRRDRITREMIRKLADEEEEKATKTPFERPEVCRIEKKAKPRADMDRVAGIIDTINDEIRINECSVAEAIKRHNFPATTFYWWKKEGIIRKEGKFYTIV